MSRESGQKDIEKIRRDYAREKLVEDEAKDHPINQFSHWFEQVISAELLDPNAMTLSTADEDGHPSSRIVLLKGFDESGFRFYTNYGSRKGRELAQNPWAALCFFWAPLERQVRIEGSVERLSREDSKNYFRQRPRLSKIGAWASQQSREIDSRQQLEDQFSKIKSRFEDQEVPLPDFWGGYLVKPVRIEFWQGRRGRMHDRICYKKEDNAWVKFRLEP